MDVVVGLLRSFPSAFQHACEPPQQAGVASWGIAKSDNSNGLA